MRDTTLDKAVAQSVDADIVTSTATGTGVDLREHNAATVLFIFGESNDTLSGSVYVTPTLEESDTLGSGYTTVAAADMSGTLSVVDAAAEDSTVQVVGYMGTKRYVRAVFTLTGTHTNGIPVSAYVVRELDRHAGGAAA